MIIGEVLPHLFTVNRTLMELKYHFDIYVYIQHTLLIVP